MNIPLFTLLVSLITGVSWSQTAETLKAQGDGVLVAAATNAPHVARSKGGLGQPTVNATEARKKAQELYVWQKIILEHLKYIGYENGFEYYRRAEGTITVYFSKRELPVYKSLQDDLGWLPNPDDKGGISLRFMENQFLDIRREMQITLEDLSVSLEHLTPVQKARVLIIQKWFQGSKVMPKEYTYIFDSKSEPLPRY